MKDLNLKLEHRRLTRGLWLFAAGSFAFGFALVPLYSVLCSITGYGDRSQLAQASMISESTSDRTVTVEFVSSVPTFGEWEFKPHVGSLKVHPGKLYEATFFTKNLRTQAVTGQAIPSVSPLQATAYFHKTECFCFTPQQFDSLQGRDLTVRFIIDPALPANIDRVSLAYGMFTASQQETSGPTG